jgi:glycosyltransferase involved in cell wall biosynthesis
VTISFIIPAHDEELLLPGTLEAVQASMPADTESEVIVVDDASTDRTAEIAAAHGARVVRIEARQIAAARNAGAAAARGDMLVFVDADTRVNPGVVAEACRVLAGGAVGGGSAVRFDEPIPRYAARLLGFFTWLSRRLRMAAGCFLFCRRDAFEHAGGFDAELFASEEVALSRALGKQGRFVILEQPVQTSGRKLRTYSGREILARTLRILLRGRRGVRERRHLDLWYGPRRPDPGTLGSAPRPADPG